MRADETFVFSIYVVVIHYFAAYEPEKTECVADLEKDDHHFDKLEENICPQKHIIFGKDPVTEQTNFLGFFHIPLDILIEVYILWNVELFAILDVKSKVIAHVIHKFTGVFDNGLLVNVV